MQCAWQVEIDEFCQRVLEEHWPGVPRFANVRECGRDNLSTVDLVCGGFPCQSVSYAGKRQGAMDDRWLWPEFHRIICELEPKWVLVENVPGLLSIDAGRLFAGILRDLAQSGYDAEWDCIPAAAFGAPHLRWRLFLVAYPGSERCKEQCELPGRVPQAVGSRQAFSDSDGGRRLKREQEVCTRQSYLAGRCEDVADSNCQRRIRRPRIFKAPRQTRQFPVEGNDACWTTEPELGRVAHGVPDRVDRLRAIGNAVVPQIAEWIGKRIVAAEACR